MKFRVDCYGSHYQKSRTFESESDDAALRQAQEFVNECQRDSDENWICDSKLHGCHEIKGKLWGLQSELIGRIRSQKVSGADNQQGSRK